MILPERFKCLCLYCLVKECPYVQLKKMIKELTKNSKKNGNPNN